jgi:hypothetical protein
VMARGVLYIATMPVRISVSGSLASDGGRLASATVTTDQVRASYCVASRRLRKPLCS